MGFILHLLIFVSGLLTRNILIEQMNNINDVFWLKYVTNDDVFLLYGRLGGS